MEISYIDHSMTIRSKNHRNQNKLQLSNILILLSTEDYQYVIYGNVLHWSEYDNKSSLNHRNQNKLQLGNVVILLSTEDINCHFVCLLEDILHWS